MGNEFKVLSAKKKEEKKKQHAHASIKMYSGCWTKVSQI